MKPLYQPTLYTPHKGRWTAGIFCTRKDGKEVGNVIAIDRIADLQAFFDAGPEWEEFETIVIKLEPQHQRGEGH